MTDPPRKPAWWRRARPRIGLRALMALVLVVGGGLGWVAHRARVQREAVAAIVGAGGQVKYDWEWDAKTGRALPPGAGPPAPRWIVDRLGPDYFGHVAAVFLMDGSRVKITDDLMALVGRLDRLDTLNLNGYDTATDSMLTHLGGLSRLRRFTFVSNRYIKGSFLTQVEDMSGLEELILVGLNLDDADLARLAGLTRLEKLDVSGDRITDAGVAHLAGLTSLKQLALNSPLVSDAGLAHLRRMVGLWTLQLSGKSITGAGLVYLRGMRRLTWLHLDGTGVASLEGLGPHRELLFLRLAGTPITDEGLKPVAGFPKLFSLTLWNAKIGDAGLAHLRGLPLINLTLDGTRITDAGLAHLSGLATLQGLSLNRTGIGDAGMGRLAGLDSLTSLSVANTRVTDEGLLKLTELKSCTQINVGSTAVTDAGIAEAARKRPQTRFIRMGY